MHEIDFKYVTINIAVLTIILLQCITVQRREYIQIPKNMTVLQLFFK